ncbi:glycosyltransferase family 4 protein [Clostridium sp. 'White wine YQ']|uniref:glycosyltransferase family 4 protein n=1 Tax=Clostridium sp. 'White wine YQ' TaxID=3027474 RepID=UPI0023672E0E|nr:glycosyltransferase family 1 protein [Clostridium sp. 'White wine YQ']MDD7792662.1 glycosyltransferase family 1 protein [Clostridium sp. 'White wine YQ']
MDVCIDVRGLNWYRGTGIGTYTYNLLKNILGIESDNKYHLIWSGDGYESFINEKISVLMASKKHQRFFENYYIPSYIEKKHLDIYHVPQNGMGLAQDIPCNKIVTIHDLIPYILPETVGAGYLKRFLMEMPKIIENSQGIITVSEYSKKDILRFFPHFSDDDIFVTPLAANEEFRPLDKDKCKNYLSETYNISTPYFLYLGGFSSRKNVKGLILAFEKALLSFNKPTSLVIVGSLREEGEALKSLVESKHLNQYIKFIGFCSEEVLPILYNACEAFVYPSTYEGFGLPPLEAMCCKAPVIASNITSIPEVVQDAGILINPYDILDISNSLVNLSQNDALRIALSEKAYERSKDFSWEKTAEITLKAYSKINEKYLLYNT